MTHTALRSRTARAGDTSDRGSASLQLAALLPVLFTVMFLGLQAALVSHARSVAIAAAEQGARAASILRATGDEGTAAAAQFVADAGGSDALEGAGVTTRVTATTVSVTVTGHALSVVPGWRPRVEHSVTLPRERLTTR